MAEALENVKRRCFLVQGKRILILRFLQNVFLF